MAAILHTSNMCCMYYCPYKTSDTFKLALGAYFYGSTY